MSDNNSNHHTTERLLEAYEAMLERVNGFIQRTEKDAVPSIKEALEDARKTAVEIGELTRDEAEQIAAYVKRDIHDASEHMAESGREFKQWFRFDWQLVEDRLFKTFAEVADKTALELMELAERAREANVYHTDEITGPGTLMCASCREEIHFDKIQPIPPCPNCQGTEFLRPE